jgi:hypothetical protein
VAREERQQLSKRGQEVQQSRDQRRTLESKTADTAARRPGAAFEPAKVQLPRSPIVAKPANQLGRNQTPPEAQRAPKPDPKFQPKSETPGRQPNVDRGNPQPEPRKPESEKKPTPGRSEAAPSERQVQPESQPRAKEPGAKAHEESQRNTIGLEKKAQQLSERPARVKPAASEKGATNLLKKDRQKEGREKPSPPVNPSVEQPSSPRHNEKFARYESRIKDFQP